MSSTSKDIVKNFAEEMVGRYRLLERLGRGRMAEVFKAKSFGVEGFEKTLVVKRLFPELVKAQGFTDLFVHEAKLALRLSHANVVQMFDLGLLEYSTGPTYYIATEYVAGIDLANLLARCREHRVQLPVGLCVYIAAEIAKALDHAHRRRDEQLRPLGILHRDLRPSNVLLSWEGEIKVADFGIGHAWQGLDPNKGIGNVPSSQRDYLSPEQVLAEPLDARSDIFSLGVVLYELLTQVTPFSSPDGEQTLRRIAEGTFEPVRSLRSEVPSDLSDVIEHAMARAPEQRFADAGRIYESLLSHLYSSSERFGAGDAASFAARLRDTPSRPPSLLPVAAEEEGLAREAAGDLSLGIDSLPPPPTERATETLEAAERRVTSLLVLSLGTQEVEAIARQRARVEPIITRYGGRVLDSPPDQLLAAFPSVGAKPASTEMAVRCALFALRQMTTGNGEGPLAKVTAKSGDAPWRGAEAEPSAGIHTGWARVRPDGSAIVDESFEALVATATQMSRLRPRTCGLSLSAARKVRGQFMFDASSESVSSPGLLIRDLKTPSDLYGRFVGRKPELKLLGEILSLATRRRTHIITLVGAGGSGKTRLLLETRRRLQRGSYQVGFYLANCRSDGRSVPFSGLAEMVAVLSGIQNGDPPDRVLELQPRFRALGLHDEEVAALLGLLGAPDNGPTGLVPLTVGFGRTVTSLCSEQLQIFAWDNAQAMDDRSLEVLRGVITRLAPTRAVFLFAGRDLPGHFFETHPNYHPLVLGELDDETLRELVAQRTGVREPPARLVSFCSEWAGGNPLHIEELLRHLVDAGALSLADGEASVIRLPESTEAPLNLNELLVERSQHLHDDERPLVELAAVLGDPAPLEILAQMSGMPWPEIEKRIDALEEQAVFRRTAPSTISFVCPLLREAVLGEIPDDIRARMHETAAHAYEESLGDRALDQVDRLAFQLLEAGNREKAALMHARAAEREASRQRFEAAVRSLSCALSLADFDQHKPQELAQWVHQLSTLAYYARSAPGIAGLAPALLRRVDQNPDLASWVQTRVDLASILVSTHEFDEADRHLDEARALAQGQASLLRATILTQAELLRRRGDFRKALERFEELSSLAPSDPEVSARAVTGLSVCCAATGEKARALAMLESLTRTPEGERITLAERARLRLMIAVFSRDFTAATQEGERAVGLARGAGITYDVALCLNLWGQALLRAGDRARAYACLQQSSTLCEEAAEERLGAHSRAFVAYLDAKGNADEANGILSDFIEYASVHRYLWDEANGRHLLAQLLRDRGELARAEAEFEACRTLAASIGYRLIMDDCREALEELRSG